MQVVTFFQLVAQIMVSTFLIRVGLLLIPVALIPFVQLIETAAPGTNYPELFRRSSDIIGYAIPVLFAVFASLTEPNNSKSWQILSTIIVFFIIRKLFSIYTPDIPDINLLSAFASSVITAAFSSRITANTLLVRRYILSRIQNLGILLFWCIITIILVSVIRFILLRLFNAHDESNMLLQLPSEIQTFIFGFVFQLCKPFGLDNYLLEFLTANQHIVSTGNVTERFFLYSYTNVFFLLPSMLAVLCIKISDTKKLPVLFMAFICFITSFFPGKEGFIYLTFIWIWPGLFAVHMFLSAIYLTVLIHIPSLEVNQHFIADLLSGSYFNDNFLNIGNMTAAGLIGLASLMYFATTIVILNRIPASRMTWKIKKHKNVRIRLIRDIKGSKDLSLLAIRLIKMAGGLDNLSWIASDSARLKIGCNNLKLVNREALKGFGNDSYVNSDEKTIFINTSEPLMIERVRKKIMTFASREFLYLSSENENR